jgi:integrase
MARSKHPSYVSGENFVARVRMADGTVQRFKQKVPPHLTAPSDRVKWARGVVRHLKDEQSRALTLEYLNRLQRKRTCCTMGDVFERLNDESVLVRKTLKDQRKNVNQLYRVLAMALDEGGAGSLWEKHAGGISGVKIGEMVPDRARIHALPATVLNAETVTRYFKRALGVERLEWMTVYEGAGSINSRLLQARSNFQGLTFKLKLRDLELPDLEGFMGGRLKTDDALPEPVLAAEFAKVVELFESLRDGGYGSQGYWLWLCDLVIRQTGMRSLSSAMQLHRDWLQRLEDGYWINVEGKTRYQVPITDELAEEMLRSENFTFFPDAPDADEVARRRNAGLRAALLDEHTVLLTGVIGAGSGGQVNHRMRDTVASACYHWLGMAVAQEALGHADVKTTRKHYARRIDVSAVMKHELRAWRRVLRKVEEAPSNVVPMVPAGRAEEVA